MPKYFFFPFNYFINIFFNNINTFYISNISISINLHNT